MVTTFEWSDSVMLAHFIILLAVPAIIEILDDRTQHDLQHDLHDGPPPVH